MHGWKDWKGDITQNCRQKLTGKHIETWISVCNHGSFRIDRNVSTAREPSSWAPPPIAQHHGHQRTGNEWCDCAQNLKGNKTTWQIWWNCCCTHYRLVFSSQGNRNAWKPRENYSHTQIHLWQALEYVNPFRYKSETPTATRHAFAPTIWGHHQALFQTFVQLLQERKINEMQKSNCLKMRFELHIVKFLNKHKDPNSGWQLKFEPHSLRLCFLEVKVHTTFKNHQGHSWHEWPMAFAHHAQHILFMLQKL